jgi:hypothetical protein
MRCPVDGKMVNATNVPESTLSPEQLEEARRYHT